MIEIEIDKKLPSVNHLYWHRGNIKILKTEARELREYIKTKVLLQALDKDIEDLKDKALWVKVEVHESWYTKKGTIAKKDIANKEKFFIDSVFKALDLDDKQIFVHEMIKINNSIEKAKITIKEMPDIRYLDITLGGNCSEIKGSIN